MLDLRNLTARIADFPDQSIRCLVGGKPTRHTYADLARDIAQARMRLSALGAQQGMRVAIRAENSYRWLVYDLALLDLRCQTVAFPEEFSWSELETVCDDLGVGLVLVGPKQRGWCNEADFVVELDAEDTRARVRRDAHREDDPDFERPTLIFSSGTTGRLKCMAVNRLGVEQFIAELTAGFSVHPDDAVLAFLPLSNFQQRLMAYTALLCGVEFQLTNPVNLFRALRELRPTVMVGPPMLYELIETSYLNVPRWKRLAVAAGSKALRAVLASDESRRVLRALLKQVHEPLGGRMRVMITGMAPIRRSTLERLWSLGLPVYQVYGLTECGIVAANFPGRNRLGSVGQPISKGAVFLGRDGEIMIRRQPLLTHGYIGVSAAEASATYLADSTVATGDIGRIDEEGYLYVTGRKKDIIVTAGGYKLHPEVLEEKLQESPAIARAVVFGGGSSPGLVAVAALRSPQERARAEEHIAKLNHTLPQPRRISRTIFTDSEFTVENGLLTRNLKVNRAAVGRRFGVTEQLVAHAAH